jgi:hypothetical protein
MKVRMYLTGFNEAFWEEFSQAVGASYPEAEVHFETTLARPDGLIICLLIEIAERDPDFFNALRLEKTIAWWDYPDHPPSTRWLDPPRQRPTKSD